MFPERATRDQRPRILVPVDFSGECERALELAISLSRQTDADLHLLHVWRSPAWYEESDSRGAEASRPENAPHRWATLHLDSLAQRVDEAGVRCHRHLEEGRASPTIAAFAGRLEADLVVVATTGRSSLENVLLGAVAERVVRTAPCPVLTLPLHAPLPDFRTTGRIVVGVDFSPASARAVDLAVDLAAELHSRGLVFAHVFHIPVELASVLDQAAVRAIPASDPERYDEMKVRVEALRAAGRKAELRVLREPSPEQALVSLARRVEAELIVIGTRGRSALGSAFLGSVANRVIRTAPCPVVTVR